MNTYAVDIQLNIKGKVTHVVAADSEEEAKKIAAHSASKLDAVHSLDRKTKILSCELIKPRTSI